MFRPGCRRVLIPLVATIALVGLWWNYFPSPPATLAPDASGSASVEPAASPSVRSPPGLTPPTPLPSPPDPGADPSGLMLPQSGPAVAQAPSTVARLPARPVLAGPGDTDHNQHHVMVAGHKAHPTRLLAKFKAAVSDDDRRRALDPLGLREEHSDPLMPHWAILDSTRGEPSPVADAAEARRRGANLAAQIQSLVASGQFEYVEPDYLLELDRTPMTRRSPMAHCGGWPTPASRAASPGWISARKRLGTSPPVTAV
jgi:hypothetical protein